MSRITGLGCSCRLCRNINEVMAKRIYNINDSVLTFRASTGLFSGLSTGCGSGYNPSVIMIAFGRSCSASGCGNLIVSKLVTTYRTNLVSRITGLGCSCRLFGNIFVIVSRRYGSCAVCGMTNRTSLSLLTGFGAGSRGSYHPSVFVITLNVIFFSDNPFFIVIYSYLSFECFLLGSIYVIVGVNVINNCIFFNCDGILALVGTYVTANRDNYCINNAVCVYSLKCKSVRSSCGISELDICCYDITGPLLSVDPKLNVYTGEAELSLCNFPRSAHYVLAVFGCTNYIIVSCIFRGEGCGSGINTCYSCSIFCVIYIKKICIISGYENLVIGIGSVGE